MRLLLKNRVIFHKVAAFGLLAFATCALTSCSMPEKPEGFDNEGMVHIADQLRARGDDAGAIDFYQRSVQKDPANIPARVATAEILEAHGDNANAANQYRDALTIDPDNGELHRGLGRVLIKLHQPSDAKDQYEAALRIDSDDVKAMNGLGVSLDYLGNHEAAQRTYKAALDEKADDPVTLANLAHSYVLAGAYEQAIALLEPHLKDKTSTPALRQNLTEAYAMAGMDADAERIARMDLTPEQVKQNLAYYRTQRAQLSLTPKLYADLGSFPTQAMAEIRMDQVKAVLPRESEGLIIAVTPEVKNVNGTPVFALRASGFARADKLRRFCDRLKKEQISCKAHSG